MTQWVAEALPVHLGQGPFAVSTVGLRKAYGPVTALGGVDLQVPEHGVYVLVGENGAGKSTLLRTLMGLVRPASGTIDVLGSDPALDGNTVRGFIGYVPESNRVGYAWMKVGRLIQHHAAYRPSWDPDYARRLSEIYQIDPRKPCHALSKGQSRRVQLLLALAHRPPLLLLDEPTDGLDHTIRDETLGILSEHLSDAPTTVLISTHRVYEVESLVDHVGVLSGGRILGQFPRSDLHRLLLRYWVDVPEGWTEPPDPGGHVIRRKGSAREVEWTVWGEREEVTGRLSESGATVREVTGLSVDEAAVALLSGKEAS
jgi:ABC-2 type transport system ATP-binding protein